VRRLQIRQTYGTPYHSPKLHPGPCSSVGMRRGTDRQTDRQTDRHRYAEKHTHIHTDFVANIHLASAAPRAKRNKGPVWKCWL